MQVTKKDLANGQIELTIEVTVEEIKPHLDKATARLAKTNKIPGFRPGKAPADMVKNQFGEMAVYQEATNDVISDSFYKAVKQENLQTIGQPEIKLEKVAPNNNIIYTATVSLLPSVTLGKWAEVSVKKNNVTATTEEIEKTLKQVQNMNVKETVVARAAKTGDKVEIDFEVLINKAVIEGGKSYKYPVILGEGHMIPGFEDKLSGHKANDELEFDLTFPEKYFQKNLANKLATFKVKVVAIYERELPTLDDELAKKLGFDDMAKLKTKLTTNITEDKAAKEEDRVTNEAVKAIIDTATIGAVPENLIDHEIHKMIHELEHSINTQGLDLPSYLTSINKTHDDLHKDFHDQAVERVKAALILRGLAKEEKIDVSEEELQKELTRQAEAYGDNEEAQKNLKDPNYRYYLSNYLTNQKVIKFITNKIVK